MNNNGHKKSVSIQYVEIKKKALLKGYSKTGNKLIFSIKSL